MSKLFLNPHPNGLVFDIDAFISRKHNIKYYNLEDYLKKLGSKDIKIYKEYNGIDNDGYEDNYTKYIEFYVDKIKIRGYFHDISINDLVVESVCEVTERERLGYVEKMLLNDYEYKLIRNTLHLFYDIEFAYDKYVKGKFKFVETFDEDKYDYVTNVVL